MESEFRCFADPKPRLPGGRIVSVNAVRRKLAGVRYALHPAGDAAADWLARARWHEATDFWAENNSLLFRVPAGVSNGLKPGERYAVAVADAALQEMVRGEVLWEDHPEYWDPEAPRSLTEVTSASEEVLAGPEVPLRPLRGRVSHRGKVLVTLSALLAIIVWLLLPDRDAGISEQESLPKRQSNRPPIASTISVKAVTGEALVVDTREHAHDPDGETPRLLELEPAQFGEVERIDEYSFRYQAPPRRWETDIFLYRVADRANARGEGWVFVSGDARPQTQPATQPGWSRGSDLPVRRSAKPQDPLVETQEAVAEAKVKPELGEQVQTTSAAPVQIALVAPRLEPKPKPDSKSESMPRSGPASRPQLSTEPESKKGVSVPKATPMRSRELRARIADALDAENLQQVRSLCTEAMETSASLAKFCGIVFDPNKRLFDAHPDATFALACYDQAIRLGDTEAGELAAAVRPFVGRGP